MRLQESFGNKPSRLQKAIAGLVPDISENHVARQNMSRLARTLQSRALKTQVLVVGAGERGEGVDTLMKADGIHVLETDIYLGKSIRVAADGHNLPFRDEAFDAVIIQAVLEHVIDPYRCVAEAWRVLKPQGLVYAETPFMYPVHLGANDIHRFSLVGHRVLFRSFSEIDAGVASGPGIAAAVAIRSLFLSISDRAFYQRLLKTCLPFLLFWFKYLDRLLARKSHASDFACATYFMGQKSEARRTDEEIISTHWSQKDRLNQTDQKPQPGRR
jgi:SAM-dependent methyltransferase